MTSHYSSPAMMAEDTHTSASPMEPWDRKWETACPLVSSKIRRIPEMSLPSAREYQQGNRTRHVTRRQRMIGSCMACFWRRVPELVSMLGRHGNTNINVVVGGGTHRSTDIDEGQILRFVSARYRGPGRQVQSPKSGPPSSSTPYTPLPPPPVTRRGR